MRKLANFINVEKNRYIEENINIYAKNKIGQYSKYLEKNAIFVTYLHINYVKSRADVGTGGIQNDLGKFSPIKFNRIDDFPVYNLPTLRPDIDYTEAGVDINLDLSDITILPNTIKPSPHDYIIWSAPGISAQFLLRVNNIKYNTIQSNDFYQVDLDLKGVAADVITEFNMADQIVESYYTVFDNIGTTDRCFIRYTELDELNDIAKIIDYFKNLYKNIFYNSTCNALILPEDYYTFENCWLYDYYLQKFITDTNLYYEPGTNNTLVLTDNDLKPLDFEYKYSRTLLYAIQNHTIKYVNPYNYFYMADITKPLSVFTLNHYDSVKSIRLISYENKVSEEQCCAFKEGFLQEYYPVQLIEDIKNGILSTDTPDLLDEIIFNFMTDNNKPIEIDDLLGYGFKANLRTYMYLPVIIFILNEYYNAYFRHEDVNLLDASATAANNGTKEKSPNIGTTIYDSAQYPGISSITMDSIDEICR